MKLPQRRGGQRRVPDASGRAVMRGLPIALCLVVGCTTTLAPAAPLATGGIAQAEMLSLRRAPFAGPTGGELGAIVRLRGVPTGASYAGATLVSDFAPECRGRGLLARRVRATRGSLRPLASDTTLELVFPFLGSAPTRGAARIDIAITTPDGKPHCLALPVTRAAPARDWQQTTQLSWSTGVVGELRPSSRGPRSALTVPLGVGLWLGPVQPAVELGVALGACQRCATDGALANDDGLPLHAAVGVDTWLLSAGQLALGAGAFYRATSLWAPGEGGTRYAWLHGPQLRPRLALAPPAPFNPERRRAFAVPHAALELPLGYAWDADGRGAPTFGVALRLGGTF